MSKQRHNHCVRCGKPGPTPQPIGSWMCGPCEKWWNAEKMREERFNHEANAALIIGTYAEIDR